MGRLRRFAHRVVTSWGVIWWGIPVSITTTFARVRREGPLSWSTLQAPEFWISFLITLIITGVFGGLLFEWVMGKAGFPRRRRPGGDGNHSS